MDIHSKTGQLLGRLVNHWSFWDQHEDYYLETLAPRLVASPHTGDATETPLLRELRAELAPDQWKKLADLIREYRTEVKENERRERAALVRVEEERARRETERAALLERLRSLFEDDFLSAYDFYRAHCSLYISEEEYREEKSSYVVLWAEQHLDTVPDRDQIEAIGAVEGHVQVVARAGSGKTSTLVNRALFLQQHCGVLPHEMLLLAFNRKAAEEMGERLAKKIGGEIPFTMTFHALAYALVHPEKSPLFDEPDGTQSKSRALQALIDDHLHTNRGYDEIRALMTAHYREDWERIAFGGYDRDRDDMLRYRRSLPKVAIDGTYLKSFGEKVIADFLFEHDVKYQYERNFWWSGINYRPDFTITLGENRGVIIEYFGMKGDPDYDESSQQKRDYWTNRLGWSLIELSPDDMRPEGEEGFRTTLQGFLADHGIPCVRLSEDEIWRRIEERAIDRFTKAVVGFVQRCRKLSLTPEQLDVMTHKHRFTSETEQRFVNLARLFHKSYLEHLRATGEEDFDGLLQQASQRVAAGQSVFRRKAGGGDLKNLRFIFIDEYQDFSELFHRLIEAIRTQNMRARFFCVGDDWQAINGFAGSDLRFYRDFGDVFQPARQIHLTTNYRSAASIVDVGNTLMSRFGIPARAHKTQAGSVVVADMETFQPTPMEEREHPGDLLTPAIVRLVKKAIVAGKDVVLLSRTHRLPWFVNYESQRDSTGEASLDRFLKLVRAHLPQSDRNKVSISTAHKYKGLEKRTVIVLDAVFRRYPLIHPNLMFTRILGDTIERTVDEERRLFYVAMTRAVEQLILVTRSDEQSPFVEDLRGNPSLSQVNWSDYPPVVGTKSHVTVKVGNQDRNVGEGTFAIKDTLKDEGYKWRSTPPWHHWWRTVSVTGFSAEQFIGQAPWITDADGIEVRFHDDVDEIIGVYRVNKGLWICTGDNAPTPAK